MNEEGEHMNCIGLAFAGHSARVQEHKSAKNYDNPLTDLISLIIAERKAVLNRQDEQEEE